MRYLTNILVCLFFLNYSYNYAQETSAFVKDSLTEKSIPFASIYLKSGDGAVTNEEGYFRLKTDTLQEKTQFMFPVWVMKHLLSPILNLMTLYSI